MTAVLTETTLDLPLAARGKVRDIYDLAAGREEAYKLVQGNAMRAWRERAPFLNLLCEDEGVMRHLSRDELASLFDYGFYVRHVGDSFRRIGL